MSRMDKINEEIRHQVSLILQRDINDPRIGFVTITRADVSPDLKSAKIYFTTIEKDKSFDDTVRGLERSTGFIRKLIAQRVRMKFAPEIRFIYDEAEKKNNRIEEILDIIHKEKENVDGN